MIGFVVIVLLGFIMVCYQYKAAQKVIIRKQNIICEDFPNSFGEITIFYISDIRRCLVSTSIVEQAIGIADFVVIGGNVTDKGVPLERVSQNIERLRKIGPIYFVWGEKDYEGNAHDLDALLHDYNVTILDNTRAVFESNSGELLILLGVDDVSIGRDRLDLALSDAEEAGFRILACHDSSIVNKVTADNHISLILSGYTKNPSFGGGINMLDCTKLFCSNGYRSSYFPYRYPSSEVCLLTIKANDD
ncbi:metallophosphoesterase [Ectobacillus sp. sgz5001026]|uniref:metallophosphoesterase n=1 Tax=Ectobacillus sp. sgz5001026 TaxID=3242473 RepID=UPI0036D2DD89